MQFISIYFLIFLLCAVIGYYACPGKYQYIFLVICNAVYYLSWSGSRVGSLTALVLVILITYTGAFLVERHKSKALIWTIAVLSLASLVYFKYANFILKTAASVSGRTYSPLDLVTPVGISFFTFQALGYVIDVYRGKCSPEKNLVRYAAYVSFFPTITSGPIERSNGLLKELQQPEGSKASYENITRGMMLFLYGAFVKLVVTDRLSVIADTVFNNYTDYGGGILFAGSVIYTLQIYCDFASYSLLALGTAKILGFDVIENFKAPYLAESVQEFWRRWHISLSTWFRDYVYITMGGNRCSKLRKNINLMVTFLVSGLWHGADWSFILWGALHGAYQIIGNLTKGIRSKAASAMKINQDCFSFHFWKKFFTFNCVSFAWIFFRSATISDSFAFIGRMFSEPRLWELSNGTAFNLGLDQFNTCILWIGLLVVIVMDVIKYRTDRNIDVVLAGQNIWFRIAVIVILLAVSFVYGQYGPAFNAQDFIYFQF